MKGREPPLRSRGGQLRCDNTTSVSARLRRNNTEGGVIDETRVKRLCVVMHRKFESKTKNPVEGGEKRQE